MLSTYCEQGVNVPEAERNGAPREVSATSTLPVPEVLSCYFDDHFTSHPAAMCLRWHPETLASAAQVWHLPGDVRLVGSLPEAFGVSIRRWGSNAYNLCLLWNHMCFNWASVTRDQVLNSALRPLLEALGTDPWSLLDQPIDPEVRGGEW